MLMYACLKGLDFRALCSAPHQQHLAFVIVGNKLTIIHYFVSFSLGFFFFQSAATHRSHAVKTNVSVVT